MISPATVRTEIKIGSSAGVEPQRGIACWALFGFELADIFVEAGLVGYVPTRQLQYAFTPQCMLQRLFAHSTIAAYEGSLSSGT